VVGGHALEAQLRLAVGADDAQRHADGIAGLTGESLPIRGLTDGLSRTGCQHLVVVRFSLGDDRPKGADRRLSAWPDGAGPSDLRPELRHLEEVGDVDQPPADHVGHKGMDSVAADVDRSQSHSTATLESP